MTTARVVAVSTGTVRIIGTDEPMESAIDKRPVPGHVAVGVLGLAGDTCADQESHGGVHQAVYCYAREDLDWWTEQLGRELTNGMFGENITTVGVDVSGATIGQTWRLGTAVVQVASPRIPCNTFRTWIDELGWVKRFALAGRPGAYLRVLEEGTVAAGDEIEILDQPSPLVSVAQAMRAYYGDHELMRALLEVPSLDPGWVEVGAAVLGRMRA